MAKVSFQEQLRTGVAKYEQREYAAAPASVQTPQLPQVVVQPVQPIAPRQLMDSHNRLIDLYSQQVKQAAISGEIVTDNDQNVRYKLSSGNELAERRKTARMYLLFLGFVVAAVTTGVVLLAHIGHVTSDAGQSIAVWLIMFGATQTVLTWRTLRKEQTLSPEGLHLEQIQYDAQVHQMDAQTRRMAIQYAGRAELERVRLQQSQVDAQREANRRLAEEAKAQTAAQMQRHTTPQHSLNRLNSYRPSCPHDGLHGAVDGTPMVQHYEAATEAIDARVEAPEAIEPIEVVTDVVRKQLLDFTCELYWDREDSGEYRRMHSDGRLRKGIVAPMVKRSGLTQEQRAQLVEILRQIEPPLFRYDDTTKLWALNLAHYRRAHHAVDAIDAAWTPAPYGR